MTTHRQQVPVNAVPADDEWFYLKVDNNIDPMDVVTAAYDIGDDWKYLGPEFKGEKTYRVKLVRLGYCHNLGAARQKAVERGYRLVEGQAREPFKAEFPEYDGNGPVVFGGSEWQDGIGRAHVPCLVGDFEGGWLSKFRQSDHEFFDSRFMVVDATLKHLRS